MEAKLSLEIPAEILGAVKLPPMEIEREFRRVSFGLVSARRAFGGQGQALGADDALGV